MKNLISLFCLLLILCTLTSCTHKQSNKDNFTDSISDVSYRSVPLKIKKKRNKIITRPKVLTDVSELFSEKYNISRFLNGEYLGAFGINYQEITFVIDSTKKIDRTNNYTVFGSTRMKHKKTHYVGKIELYKIVKSNLNPYGEFDSTYYLIDIEAKYKLIEDTADAKNGIFSGKLAINLIMNDKGTLYDGLYDWLLDGYSNYQFQGIWTSKNGKQYQCVFGDGRLLNTGDLDCGVGEFIPNEKYYKYGWKEYMDRIKKEDKKILRNGK